MAVGDAHVIPGFLMPALTQLSFQSHQLLFSHASVVLRGQNTLERRFTSTGYQTRNHQVMPARSPLSHLGGCLAKEHSHKKRSGKSEVPTGNLQVTSLGSAVTYHSHECS